MAQASASTKKTVKAPVTKKNTKVQGVSNKPFAQGTGRRKSAVARAWLKKGNGQITVNGRSLEEYFTVQTALDACKASFNLIPMTSGMSAEVNVVGGGYTAQADAIQLSIARALLQFDETLKPELRKNGYITVDSRVKERKKYGQKAARRKFQFTKR